jgi:hypothetical protein
LHQQRVLRQAAHQDANKFNNDTSPARLAPASPSERPLTGGRLKSGTGLRI